MQPYDATSGRQEPWQQGQPSQPGDPAQPVAGYPGQPQQGYPAPGPPGMPPVGMPSAGKPRSGGKGLLIGAIVAVVLLVLCGGAGVAGVLLLRNSDRGGVDGGGSTVRLEATSDNGSIALVTWRTSNDVGTEPGVSSPWSREVDISGETEVSMVVTDPGTITCKIILNGTVRSAKQVTDGIVICSAQL
ncbi:hypothetical protein ACWDV4_09875 [Micromonospora sp. NPDC003197]